jgi:hypothetical protein
LDLGIAAGMDIPLTAIYIITNFQCLDSYFFFGEYQVPRLLRIAILWIHRRYILGSPLKYNLRYPNSDSLSPKATPQKQLAH